MRFEEVIDRKVEELDNLSIDSKEFSDAAKGLKDLMEAERSMNESCAKIQLEEEKFEVDKKSAKKNFWLRVVEVGACVATAAGAIIKVVADYNNNKADRESWEAKVDQGYDLEYGQNGLVRTNTFKDVLHKR